MPPFAAAPNEIGRVVETVQVIREELDSILKDNL